MSDDTFWLIVSVMIIVLGIMLMLIGWNETEHGGWACVIGLMSIITGAFVGGSMREERKK